MKKNILVFLIVALIAPFAVAEQAEIWMKKRWDYAVDGYDTVAYHTQNEAIEGNDQFVTEYKGVNWRFSSAENLELFKQDPDKYRPQYGGHCAYGLGKNGVLVHGDPERWSLVDGKLYLNLNKRLQKKWSNESDFYIKHADAVWPRALTEEIEVDW